MQKDADKMEEKFTGYLAKLAEGWKIHFKTLHIIKTRPIVKETKHKRIPQTDIQTNELFNQRFTGCSEHTEINSENVWPFLS